MNSSSLLGRILGTDTATAPQRLGLWALYLYLASPMVIQVAIGGRQDLRNPVFVLNIIATFLWIALAHFSVRRPLFLHLALLPLYLTTTVDLFLLEAFGTRLTSAYVTIFLGNRSDTADFISSFFRPILVVAIAFPVIYINGLYHIGALRKPRSPKLMGLTAVALAGAYALLLRQLHLYRGEPIQSVLLDIAAHETSAPMGAIFQTGLALKLHSDGLKTVARRSSFSFGASKAPLPGEEIYVWVIGESSRPESWSLFGYSRDTTPRLGAIPGIITLPNMMTTAPETQLAVPSMLSLRPITDWPSIQAQKSVVAAFDEAGFKTYWLSTQDVDGWSGLIPQVAAEAGTLRYFSQSLDGALLNEFRAILEREPKGDGKLFIVLHTKGSHFEYKNRYPTGFSQFVTPHGARRDRFVDAYDNSVLYTDWFLAELISMLDERNTPAALLYASDHGENLFDDDRQLLGHTRGTEHDLSTASFFWLSDELRARDPARVSNLLQHAELPLSLSNLSHSMLELSGIEAPARDLRMSVFSSQFELHPRYYLLGSKLLNEHPEVTAPSKGY